MSITGERGNRIRQEAATAPENRTMAQKAVWAVVVCASGIASLALFFHEFLLSGFNSIAGTRDDCLLFIALVEHWYYVFLGKVPDFTSPNFFAPIRGVLGYSDALFLFAPPYALLRAFGLDRFVSFELVLIGTRAFGFAAMYVLLARCVRVSRWLALTGAVLFTISNMYYVDMQHAQFSALSFVPAACILACEYWRQHRNGRYLLARVLLAALSALVALLFFTSFYVGWFLIIATAALAAVAALFAVVRTRSLLPLKMAALTLKQRSWDAVLACVVLAVFLVPFVYVYLPALKRTGGRQYDEAFYYTPNAVDIVNVGPDNLVWKRPLKPLLDRLITRPADYEKRKGWPPLIIGMLVVIAVTTTAALLRRGGRRTSFGSGISARHSFTLVRRQYQLFWLCAILGVTSLVLCGMSSKVSRVSPWWFVFRLVPGASAIRAPGRFNLLLNIMVITAVVAALEYLRIRRFRFAPAVYALVPVVLILEQINLMTTHRISRSAEQQLLSHVGSTPAYCRAFYIAGPTDHDDEFFSSAAQVHAMLVARERDVPTLNGYTGWFPDGWELLAFDEKYPAHAQSWAAKNGITSGLCSLDLNSGSWMPVSSRRTNAIAVSGDHQSR